GLCAFIRFFLHAAAPSQVYALSLHDALPISAAGRADSGSDRAPRCGWFGRVNSCDLAPVPRSLLAPRSRRPLLSALTFGCTPLLDRKSTRLNSSHVKISYAVFCLKKKRSECV